MRDRPSSRGISMSVMRISTLWDVRTSRAAAAEVAVYTEEIPSECQGMQESSEEMIFG